MTRIALGLAVSSLALFSACSSDPADGRSPDGLRQGAMPPLYVDLDVDAMPVMFDEPQRYQDELQRCADLEIAPQRLSGDEEQLLGKGRHQVWIDGDVEAVREEYWSFGQGETESDQCNFWLVSSGGHGIYERNGNFTIYSFIDGSIETRPNPTPGIWSQRPDYDPADLDEEQLAGDGYVGPRASTKGGQPCDEWTRPGSRDGDQTLCVWSGGKEYDFHPDPYAAVVDLAPYPFNDALGVIEFSPVYRIILGSSPSSGEGDGQYVTLRTFTSGPALDSAGLAPLPPLGRYATDR